MEKKTNLTIIVALAIVASVSSASALTISAIPGTSQNVSSVTDLVTSGGALPNMIGLNVTATFANGTTDVLSWATISGTTAGVSSGDFSLQATGNTFAALWLFTGGSSPITSLSFAGIPSNIAFDRTAPSPGTTGSAAGVDFTPDTNGDGFADNPAGWTVTYSDQITLNGASAVGDLYGSLSINFGTGGYTGNFSFLQDTDSFVPAGTTVPEPTSLLLLGTGIGALGLVAWRRKK